MGIDISQIEHLGLDRVLKRGTGEIIFRSDEALLIRDSVSEALLLACDDISSGISILDRHMDQNCSLLMVSNQKLGEMAFGMYGFSEKLECFQVAYYGEPPVVDPGIAVRTADKNDLPLLLGSYHLISPEEQEKVVERQTLIMGYCQEQLIGFMGEHLEGSMGLLYIFPPFRRRGYAAKLEKIYIARTMEKGFVPFGQVEKGNRASLFLQQKIGMTQSENLICWMWK